MSVIEKPKYIFINKYWAHIAQKVSIGFSILRVKERLAIEKNYNYNTNQPLLYIIRIMTHYFTI